MAGYINAPDNLFNNKQVIKFQSAFVGTQAVKFHAFVTDYSDNFESNWERDETYGRMDDIQSFQSTKRTIELGWQTVAASRSEAVSNLRKVELLIQMLYPPYTHGGGEIFNINGAPVLRLKFMNLIQDARSGGGLMGTMSGLTATPDIELGFFPSDDNAKVYPKVIELSCTFYPLHEHLLGWLGNQFNQSNFPYGAAGAGKTATSTLPQPPPPDIDGIPTGADLDAAFNAPEPGGISLAMTQLALNASEKNNSSGVNAVAASLNGSTVVPKEEVAAKMNNTSKKKKKPKQVEESQAQSMLAPAVTEAHPYSEEGQNNMSEPQSQTNYTYTPGAGGPEDPGPTVTQGEGGPMINFGEYSEGDHAIESAQAHFLGMGPLADTGEE